MNTKNLKILLNAMIKAKTPVTPMVWGQHGIGKSAIVHQIGKERGYRVLDIRLSQKEAVDLSGVLYTFEDSELKMSVTAAHPPQWFADAIKKGNLIIFLDEFNMGRREVMNAAFELVLDRKLNNLPLPDSVFIITAGNPEDERYEVTPMSESLKDRLMHLQTSPDSGVWLDWAKNSTIHQDIQSFIRSTPTAGFADDERNRKFPVELQHSFRSWERASHIYKLDIPSEIKLEAIRGIVGMDLAIAFMNFCEGGDAPLTADQIIEWDKKTVKKLSLWGEQGRSDLLTVTRDNVILALEKGTKITDKELARFLLVLPKDSAAVLISKAYKGGNWAVSFKKNKELQALIQSIKESSKS